MEPDPYCLHRSQPFTSLVYVEQEHTEIHAEPDFCYLCSRLLVAALSAKLSLTIRMNSSGGCSGAANGIFMGRRRSKASTRVWPA